MAYTELEQRMWRLRVQVAEASQVLHDVTETHGLSRDEVFLTPAMDTAAFEQVIAIPNSRAAQVIRDMQESRGHQIEALPPDVRAAADKLNEVSALLTMIEKHLVHELHALGVDVAAIASRISTTEAFVNDTLQRGVPTETLTRQNGQRVTSKLNVTVSRVNEWIIELDVSSQHGVAVKRQFYSTNQLGDFLAGYIRALVDLPGDR